MTDHHSKMSAASLALHSCELQQRVVSPLGRTRGHTWPYHPHATPGDQFPKLHDVPMMACTSQTQSYLSMANQTDQGISSPNRQRRPHCLCSSGGWPGPMPLHHIPPRFNWLSIPDARSAWRHALVRAAPVRVRDLTMPIFPATRGTSRGSTGGSTIFCTSTYLIESSSSPCIPINLSVFMCLT